MSLPTRPGDKASMCALDRKCADPNSVVSKRTARQIAAESLVNKEVFLHKSTVIGLGNLVRCALEAGVSPDTTSGEDTGSMRMLVLAAQRGHAPALKALLASGASIELVDNHRSTALGWAAREGQLSCLQLLLDAGADANTQDDLGNTPLMSAVMNKQVECARALLPASELAITSGEGNTALHAAVLTASEACFELLLPLCDVDVRTMPGVLPSGEAVPIFNATALHIACQRGQLAMCKALLSRGADRMARDSAQYIPLHLAAAHGHVSCVVMLVGRPGKVRMTPAEVDAADENGWTALHLAARYGYEQICGVLLGAGARLDAETSDCATPLMLAQDNHPTNGALHALLSGDAPSQPLGLVCDHCGEEASVKGLKSCGKCYAVRYCGKECQAAAWPGHRAACKARVEELEDKTRARCVHTSRSSSSPI